MLLCGLCDAALGSSGQLWAALGSSDAAACKAVCLSFGKSWPLAWPRPRTAVMELDLDSWIQAEGVFCEDLWLAQRQPLRKFAQIQAAQRAGHSTQHTENASTMAEQQQQQYMAAYERLLKSCNSPSEAEHITNALRLLKVKTWGQLIKLTELGLELLHSSLKAQLEAEDKEDLGIVWLADLQDKVKQVISG